MIVSTLPLQVEAGETQNTAAPELDGIAGALARALAARSTKIHGGEC